MEPAAELMTIQDLAERWGVSLAKAKRHVRRNHVPFIQIGSDADLLVNWSTTRFKLAVVRKWEDESMRVFDETPKEEKPKATAPGKYKYIKMK